MSSRARLAATLVVAAGLGGCVSKSDVQMVQGEVSLLRAETLRRDSTRAAQLAEVIQVQRQIMDSLTTTKRAIGHSGSSLQLRRYELPCAMRRERDAFNCLLRPQT